MAKFWNAESDILHQTNFMYNYITVHKIWFGMVDFNAELLNGGMGGVLGALVC